MFGVRQRGVAERIFSSKITVAVLVVVAVVLGRSVLNVYQKYQEAAANYARADKELSSLKDDQATFSAAVTALNTPSGVEDEIRRKFQMTKQGENLIVIVDDGSAAATTVPAAVSGSWWARVGRFLGL